MTPLFFLGMYFLGLLMTLFKNPIFGVYTYLFTFYMSPKYSWWSNAVPELRYLFIVGLISVISLFMHGQKQDRPGWLDFAGARLFLGMVLWMWVQYFWAVDQEIHLDGTIEYTKHLIIFFLIYKLFDTRQKIYSFLIAHAFGCFWFGYLALDASGGRLESIGGPVGGSNSLGGHVATAMITGGIMWLVVRGWQRWFLFFCMPLIANTIVLTVSRGAFLGFFAAGVIGGAFIPRFYRGKYLVLSILALILVSMLAHDEIKDRFWQTYQALTSDTEEIDHSAASRVEIFNAGIQIGLDYPLGAGYRGTKLLSPLYMDASVLSKTGGRSAHNTFAAIFAEHGFVGAALYIVLVSWVIKTLFRIKNASESRMSKEDKALAVSLIAAIMGMWVSGMFSNFFFTETQYWLLALLCAQLSRTLDATSISAAGLDQSGITKRDTFHGISSNEATHI